MAQPPGPGPCTYCLQSVEVRNWDHVYPRAWYPDTTPANIEKWKVPSCLPCNSENGKNEEDLLLRFGMCVGPEDAAASGIPKLVIRSMDPRLARNEKDLRARLARLVGLRKEMLPPERAVLEAVVPNFRPEDNPGGGMAIRIPKQGLDRLAEKIVRGFTLIHQGRLIEQDHEIESHLLEESDAGPILELLQQHGMTSDRGPGVVIHHAFTGEDPIAGVFLIQIWNRLKLYVAVMPREEQQSAPSAS